MEELTGVMVERRVVCDSIECYPRESLRSFARGEREPSLPFRVPYKGDQGRRGFGDGGEGG